MRRSSETLISQRLKELRSEKGITQKQLASEIGVSYGSIVDYEMDGVSRTQRRWLPWSDISK